MRLNLNNFFAPFGKKKISGSRGFGKNGNGTNLHNNGNANQFLSNFHSNFSVRNHWTVGTKLPIGSTEFTKGTSDYIKGNRVNHVY